MSSGATEKSLRNQVAQHLFSSTGKLPVGKLGRLRRAALGVTRGTRLLLGNRIISSLRGVAEGEQLDPEALAEWITSIGQLKGVAMKMGQIMSYIDVALPEQVRDALSALQTHSQPMPFDDVEQIVRAELGDDAGALLEAMQHEPLAAASIGQVHRSKLPDGTPVAVKVQYPGIDRAIANDFGFASIGWSLSAELFPLAHIREIFEELKSRILEECDYEHEAAMQQRFSELYAKHSVIVVPAVHPRWCSSRVLTSTYVEGMSFEDYLARDPPQESRDRLGEALFEFYVGSLFRNHLYNCDPHPGNYLPRTDGTIAMLDYGCCREFEPAFVAKLVALTLAVHSDSRDALHQAFLGLGMVEEGRDYDFATARDLARAFHGPMLRDEIQAVDLGVAMQMRHVIERKMELLKLSLPGEFLFLFRIRFGLMSILARLGARANWYRLERTCIGA